MYGMKRLSHLFEVPACNRKCFVLKAIFLRHSKVFVNVHFVNGSTTVSDISKSVPRDATFYEHWMHAQPHTRTLTLYYIRYHR